MYNGTSHVFICFNYLRTLLESENKLVHCGRLFTSKQVFGDKKSTIYIKRLNKFQHRYEELTRRYFSNQNRLYNVFRDVKELNILVVYRSDFFSIFLTIFTNLKLTRYFLTKVFEIFYFCQLYCPIMEETELFIFSTVSLFVINRLISLLFDSVSPIMFAILSYRVRMCTFDGVSTATFCTTLS